MCLILPNLGVLKIALFNTSLGVCLFAITLAHLKTNDKAYGHYLNQVNIFCKFPAQMKTLYFSTFEDATTLYNQAG